MVKLKSPKSPSPPNDLLVTAGFNLQIYHRLNPKKDHPKKTFSRFQVKTNVVRIEKLLIRFQDKVYSGTWRRDGALIAAGSEEGTVKIFDTAGLMTHKM